MPTSLSFPSKQLLRQQQNESRFFSGIKQALQHLRIRRRQKETLLQLQHLNDHLLSDLGLNRAMLRGLEAGKSVTVRKAET